VVRSWCSRLTALLVVNPNFLACLLLLLISLKVFRYEQRIWTDDESYPYLCSGKDKDCITGTYLPNIISSSNAFGTQDNNI
jgi:hypothetical protein